MPINKQETMAAPAIMKIPDEAEEGPRRPSFRSRCMFFVGDIVGSGEGSTYMVSTRMDSTIIEQPHSSARFWLKLPSFTAVSSDDDTAVSSSNAEVKPTCLSGVFRTTCTVASAESSLRRRRKLLVVSLTSKDEIMSSVKPSGSTAIKAGPMTSSVTSLSSFVMMSRLTATVTVSMFVGRVDGIVVTEEVVEADGEEVSISGVVDGDTA